MEILLIVLALVALYLFYRIFIKNKKGLKYGDLVLITGGIKTGKTTMCVDIILKEYSTRIKAWKKECFFINIYNKFHKNNKKELTEKPLIYSNMPLSVPYVQLTKDLILRKERYANKSIVYINEATFLASQFDYKDDFINSCLTLHNKLIGHELKGGIMIVDTQSPKDLHFSFKNALSNYVWIHHKKSFFHFWLKLYVREMIYQDNSTNDFTSDVEDTLVQVVIRKSVWKYFDCYAYSSLTDDLPLNDRVVIPNEESDLKIKEIVSLKKGVEIYGKKNISKNN